MNKKVNILVATAIFEKMNGIGMLFTKCSRPTFGQSLNPIALKQSKDFIL